MRILAVDPGSTVTAYAYFFDDALRDLAQSSQRGRGLSWMERLERIAIATYSLAEERRWEPDVIAMEDLVFGRDPHALIIMGMTRGYLIRLLSERYPRAEWIEPNLSRIKRELGLASNAKRIVRQQAARARFPTASTEDEADAAAVGMTAARIIAERRAQAGMTDGGR